MRIGRNEIIEELTEHIRKMGGEPGEWCVGTAKDSTLNDKLPLQNSSETLTCLPGLAYREAHTPYAAADAVDYLVSAFGLHPAPEAERCSALHGQAEHHIPEPGKIVFVYRRGEVHQDTKSVDLHAVAT